MIISAPTPLTETITAEFYAKQSKDLSCLVMASTVITLGFKYSYNRSGFLDCIDPIPVAVQNFVAQSLQLCFLYEYHYKWIAGNTKELSMYDKWDMRCIESTW